MSATLKVYLDGIAYVCVIRLGGKGERYIVPNLYGQGHYISTLQDNSDFPVLIVCE